MADYTARFVEYQTMLLPANIFVNSDPNSFCGHAFVNDNSFRLGFFLSMLSRMVRTLFIDVFLKQIGQSDM